MEVNVNDAGVDENNERDGKGWVDVGDNKKTSGYESEYIDSDELGSFDDGDDSHDYDKEHETPTWRRIKVVHYNPELACPLGEVRMISDNATQFKETMRKFVIVTGKELMFNKNDSDKVRVICKGKFPFFIHVSKNGDNEFHIKCYDNE